MVRSLRNFSVDDRILWNPKDRTGHVAFPPPTVHLQVLGCWPVDAETGRTRDSAGESAGTVSGDLSDSRLVLQGGDGGEQREQKMLKFRLKRKKLFAIWMRWHGHED